MKHAILSLYRRCLRSAGQCPTQESKRLMKNYVRDRFERDSFSNSEFLNQEKNPFSVKLDEATVTKLLDEGIRELADMNYYHSVRLKKEQKIKESENQMRKEIEEGKEVNHVIVAIQDHLFSLSDILLGQMNIKKRRVNVTNVKKLLKFYKCPFSVTDDFERLMAILHRFIAVQSKKI